MNRVPRIFKRLHLAKGKISGKEKNRGVLGGIVDFQGNSDKLICFQPAALPLLSWPLRDSR
jgi:hypothetical protein